MVPNPAATIVLIVDVVCGTVFFGFAIRYTVGYDVVGRAVGIAVEGLAEFKEGALVVGRVDGTLIRKLTDGVGVDTVVSIVLIGAGDGMDGIDGTLAIVGEAVVGVLVVGLFVVGDIVVGDEVVGVIVGNR